MKTAIWQCFEQFCSKNRKTIFHSVKLTLILEAVLEQKLFSVKITLVLEICASWILPAKKSAKVSSMHVNKRK